MRLGSLNRDNLININRVQKNKTHDLKLIKMKLLLKLIL